MTSLDHCVAMHVQTFILFDSKCGWDHVGQGMVQLGFLLMDAGSQRHESGVHTSLLLCAVFCKMCKP